jgi:hypothetical protein
MRKALLLLVVLAGFAAGCENKYKDPDPQAMGHEYYPLEVGDYRVYDVTDIRFLDNLGDTNRFQIRERVDTSFYDQTNKQVYKIIRSIRLNEGSQWVDDSVIVVSMLDNLVLLTKDNTKYVKLVFPVKEGSEWIGDLFNARLAETNRESKIRDGKELYTYADVGVSLKLGELYFPKTVTVVQNSPDVFKTRLDERREVYAEGVGLVYKVFNRVVYSACFEDDCKNGPNFKLDGHERHEVLIANGKL